MIVEVIDRMMTPLTERERALLHQMLTHDEISVLDVVMRYEDEGIVQMYLVDELKPMKSVEISRAVLGLIQKKFIVKEMTKVRIDGGKFIITNLLKLSPGVRQRMANVIIAVCDVGK